MTGAASGSTAKTSLPFYLQKDGHGTEHKIIDLTHPDVLKREGIVIFEATTRKNEERANDIPFKMCKDKDSGVLIGIFAGIDERKNLKWVPIPLGKSTMFNLEDTSDAEKVAVLLRSNIVEGSPNLSKYIKLAFFRVHDELQAATLNIKRITEGQRAVSIAKGLLGEDLVNMGRNLGIKTDHANHAIVLSEVLTRAEKSPDEFLKIWENPHREQITIFHRGVDTGVISYDPITGYSFRGVNLGINEGFAIDYFNKYREVATSIDMLSKERVQQSFSPRKIEKVEDKDAELQALREENARLKNIKSDVEENLVGEFETAIAEAKELGIKPLHNYRPNKVSIAKLQARIDEVKAKQPV